MNVLNSNQSTLSFSSVVQSSILLLIAFVLISCASTAPKISDQQINAAEKNGTLESLFSQVNNRTGIATKISDNERGKLLTTIGQRLADAAIQKEMAPLTTGNKTLSDHSVIELDRVIASLSSVKKYSSSRYQSVVAKLTTEKKKKQQKIALLQSQLNDTGVDQISERIGLINQLLTLSGDEKQAFNLKQLVAEQNVEIAKEFIDARKSDLAIAQLKQIIAEIPDYQPAKTLLNETENAYLQRAFVQSVNNGEVEKAQSLFNKIRQSNNFAKLKQFITPSVLTLKDYYLALASAAIEEENLSEAFNRFSQIQQLLTPLAINDSAVNEMKAEFADFLFGLYEQAEQKQNSALALGYLNTIKQLSPNFPELDKNWRQIIKKVDDIAVKRLTVTPFNSSQDNQSLARIVSTNISQTIMNKLKNDVRIVERENLQAVLKEQEINALQKGDVITIAAADMLIQGSILEANVESNQSHGKKKIRAITGHKKIINPEYQQWLMMKTSEQNKVPTPDKYKTKEVKEDISIEVTHHRKVAILSVSYRLVDAKTAKVLLTNTFDDKKSLVDDSQESVELGEFKSPYKMANLPSNSELLRSMATGLTNKITDEIIDFLAEPAESYQKNAQLFAKQNNFKRATEEQAKAFVLMLKKKVDLNEVAAKLREYVVKTPINVE